MKKTYYECTCGKGLITKTIEISEKGIQKIGVFPCGSCFNHPHLFHLKNYKISSEPDSQVDA